MTIYVDADFETVSDCDLKVAGAVVYAQHPSTGVLCFLFEVGGIMHKWFPGDSTATLHDLVANPDVIFVAHNAGFEQAIWQYIMVTEFGLPPIPIERWEDTMATAAWKALPLGLDRGAEKLGLPMAKDKDGRSLTLSMSKFETQVDHMARYPGTGTKAAWAKLHRKDMWPERTPERMARIADYCAQDVRIETGMRKRIGLLSEQSPQERQIWIYDQRINQRGIRIDTDFVRAAQLVVAGASAELLTEFRGITGGINPTQVAQVMGWVKDQGVHLDSLRKEYLDTLLGSAEDEGYISNAVEDDDGDGTDRKDAAADVAGMPENVQRALRIRQMLGGAAVKKLDRMLACVCHDGRVRGTLQYHAASPGRWGGRLFQPQNFPRGVGLVYADGLKVPIPELVRAVLTGDHHECSQFYTRLASGDIAPIDPLTMIQSCLRYALIPDPGKVFLVGDYAGIEARIVLALAGQYDKTELLAGGHDVYLDMASTIFGEPVLKGDPRRQYGKNGVLGAGFMCGPANFNVKFLGGNNLPLAEQTVAAYRKDWAPKVPKLWYALGDASLDAVRLDVPHEAYGVRYQLEDGWLTAQLPSGWQKLWYYRPRIELNRFGKDSVAYSTTSLGKWVNKGLYGGLATENTVQGLARGLLCAAIDRLENNDMPVVLTVHDEIIVEVDEATADATAFTQLMAEPTGWAQAMQVPIAVETWQGTRYRK